jgi:hypothetical protein
MGVLLPRSIVLRKVCLQMLGRNRASVEVPAVGL